MGLKDLKLLSHINNLDGTFTYTMEFTLDFRLSEKTIDKVRKKYETELILEDLPGLKKKILPKDWAVRIYGTFMESHPVAQYLRSELDRIGFIGRYDGWIGLFDTNVCWSSYTISKESDLNKMGIKVLKLDEFQEITGFTELIKTPL